jgi:putative sterol carrier protein
MTEQQELEILRPYVTECGKLVNQNYELEKAYKATDKLLLEVLMGDIDPMQAMINRQKIKDAFNEQS